MDNSHTVKESSCLAVIVKILLMVAILIFALCNYRFLSLSKGIATRAVRNTNEFTTAVIDILTDIEEVEYYKKTISTDEYEYRVYISTSERGYLLNAAEDAIDALKLLDKLNLLEVNEVTIVPWYIDIIVAVIILFIPFGRRTVTYTQEGENS